MQIRLLLVPALAGALALFAPSTASSSISMTTLIETIDLTAPVLSPDGKTVAFRQGRASLNSNRYEISWWTVPLDGSAPARKVGDGGFAIWKIEGVPLVEAPTWSADSRHLYYRALIDGQVQVWRAQADGQKAEQVTRDDADVDRFHLGDDGKLTYAVRATRAEILNEERRLYEQGVLIDHTVDPSQTMFAAVEVNGRMASQRFSGRWFQRDGLLGETPDRIRTIDLTTFQQVEPAAGQVSKRQAPIDVFSSRKVFARSRAAGVGEVRIAHLFRGLVMEVERPDGTVLTCDAEPCRNQSLLWATWRSGRDEVVFAVRDETRRISLLAWSPGGAVRKILQEDGDLGSGWYSEPCAVGRDQVVCVFADAMTPPRLERIELANGRRKSLAEPNGPSRQTASITSERLIWRDAKGRVATGQLLRPAAAQGRLPLFINYYNCDGYLRGGTGDEWPFVTFAQNGIAALCISPIRDRKDGLDNVADYEVGLDVIQAAVDLLDKRGLVDRRKIGMGGLSNGSEVAIWVARHTNLLAALSIASVQLEPAYYWLNGVKGRDIHDGLRQAWKLGAPDETPERWKTISPAYNIDQFKAPVLMQLPEQEFRPTIEFFARMSNSKTPIEQHVFAQEPHILTQPRHRLAAYTRNLDWFRFWLQGVEDPDPAKAAQYERWRKMKEAQAKG